ncbi:MAG: sugar phosphate isomerase/epimerase [Planctomycetaceae bacterium]
MATRRDFLTGSALALATTALSKAAPDNPQQQPAYRYCLNTGTIMGQKLGIVGEVEVTAKAGYDGIEPWIRTLDEYVQQGGSLSDLRKRIADSGLKVESAIGFAAYLHEDEAERNKGLEEAKRSMEIVQAIGGNRLAAPPVGVTDKSGLDLLTLANRYRALCEIGQNIGVVPQLELWGFSKTLSRLGEVSFVGIEAAHPAACFLLDIYHIYKGGSDFSGLAFFPAGKMSCLHVNDYPAEPARAEINDSFRVYPGDGVAPNDQIYRTLRDIGFQGTFSLELFNRDYWKQDALNVARTGLMKMKETVAKALG